VLIRGRPGSSPVSPRGHADRAGFGWSHLSGRPLAPRPRLRPAAAVRRARGTGPLPSAATQKGGGPQGRAALLRAATVPAVGNGHRHLSVMGWRGRRAWARLHSGGPEAQWVWVSVQALVSVAGSIGAASRGGPQVVPTVVIGRSGSAWPGWHRSPGTRSVTGRFGGWWGTRRQAGLLEDLVGRGVGRRTLKRRGAPGSPLSSCVSAHSPAGR